MKKKSESKVSLNGNKSKGWIIEISAENGWEDDMAITHEEAIKLLKELKKKLE